MRYMYVRSSVDRWLLSHIIIIMRVYSWSPLSLFYFFLFFLGGCGRDVTGPRK